jgi:hypothetical protein
MYTPLYDDKHRFHVLSSTDANRNQWKQKGLREQLLCEDCEEQLSEHERYVSLLFSGRIRVTSERNGNLVRIRGLDYRHFKIFGLSILWRAGVSRQQFFDDVTLGPHEEPLRQLVLTNDPGNPDKYGFFLASIVFNDCDVKDLIVQPTHSRLDGHLCYRFVFGGLVWIFVVSSHKPPTMFRQAFVNLSGEMLMLVSELRDLTFIGQAMKAIEELN